jgi:integrase
LIFASRTAIIALGEQVGEHEAGATANPRGDFHPIPSPSGRRLLPLYFASAGLMKCIGIRKFFPPEELHRFLAEAHRRGPKFDLIFWLMFYFGLCTGELVKVRLDDIAT